MAPSSIRLWPKQSAILVRLINVVAEDMGRDPFSAEVAVGTAGVEKLIRKVRDRFIGALIGTASDNPPGLSAWLNCLLRHGQPVVWFDRADESDAVLPHSPLFTCCRHSDEYSSSFSRLTSVDAGFAELGYQAFHAILRDVPTRRGRNGIITARPVVVDGKGEYFPLDDDLNVGGWLASMPDYTSNDTDVISPSIPGCSSGSSTTTMGASSRRNSKVNQPVRSRRPACTCTG